MDDQDAIFANDDFDVGSLSEGNSSAGGTGSPENGFDPNQNNQGEPVKLGRLATTAILVVGVIIIAILLLTMRSCSIQKKAESQELVNSAQSSIQSEVVNIPDTEENNIEFSSKTESVISAPQEKFEPEKIVVGTDSESSSSEDETTSEEPNMLERAEPVLSDQQETAGMVVDKHVHLYDNSYVYRINLAILVNDEPMTVQYFCPKNTWDSLQTGDYLNVVYQYDSNGVFSVNTISRAE